MSTAATYLGAWELVDLQDVTEGFNGTPFSGGAFSRHRITLVLRRTVNGLTAFTSLRGTTATVFNDLLIGATTELDYIASQTMTCTNDHLAEKDRMAGDYTEETTWEYIGGWA